MTKKVSRGGRPSRAEAGMIESKILDAAAALFFSQGYGSVTIEEVARTAQISKRTFYARFEDKAALFRAVVGRIIQQVRPSSPETDLLFQGDQVEVVLRRIAPVILKASLSENALSLHRVMLAEAKRFPELALIMNEQNTRQEAITRIAKLLEPTTNQDAPRSPKALFAAEQFLFMLTAGPQRRALGFGPPMQAAELEAWATHTIDLFMHGYGLK